MVDQASLNAAADEIKRRREYAEAQEALMQPDISIVEGALVIDGEEFLPRSAMELIFELQQHDKIRDHAAEHLARKIRQLAQAYVELYDELNKIPPQLMSVHIQQLLQANQWWRAHAGIWRQEDYPG